MKFFFIILFIFSGSLLASTNAYNIKIDLSLDGQHTLTSQVVAMAGKAASMSKKINDKENFVDVVATENSVKNNHAILLKFKIGSIDANGKRTVLSEPHLLVKNNEPALISVGQNDGKAEELLLNVTVTRKIL